MLLIMPLIIGLFCVSLYILFYFVKRIIFDDRYRSDPLLMYSMKMSHLYIYLYNKKSKIMDSAYHIYTDMLEEAVFDPNAEYGDETPDSLKEKFLSFNQELKYRDVVKFCIIRNVYSNPELANLFPSSVRDNLQALIYCALLPDNQKRRVSDYLKKLGMKQEDQIEFVYCLGTIEKAVDAAIPEGI